MLRALKKKTLKLNLIMILIKGHVKQNNFALKISISNQMLFLVITK